MQDNIHWIPIYTTSRRLAAFLGYPYLFNTHGQWIGFVTPEGTVHAINGRYVGFLDPDPQTARILRRTTTASLHYEVEPPPPPTFKPQTSWTMPLPPKPPPLPPQTLDVLEKMPDLLFPAEDTP